MRNRPAVVVMILLFQSLVGAVRPSPAFAVVDSGELEHARPPDQVPDILGSPEAEDMPIADPQAAAAFSDIHAAGLEAQLAPPVLETGDKAPLSCRWM